ncbi:MAG: two-component regulator propeller domain-containing protein [Bacteroidota bacterium]
MKKLLFIKFFGLFRMLFYAHLPKRIENAIRKQLWCILFIFLAHFFVQGQSNQLKILEITDGLSSMETRCFYKDSKGLVWIGTRDGLNLYNGVEVKVFRNDPSDVQSISNNFIRTIIEDTEGNLWIGTNGGGINIFDRDTQTFRRIVKEKNTPNGLASNIIKCLYFQNADILWIGTIDGGLQRYNIKENTFKTFTSYSSPKDGSSFSPNAIEALHATNDSILWVGTWGGGLIKFNMETYAFSTYLNKDGSPVENKNDNESDVINTITSDTFGNLWIGTQRNGLFKLDTTRDVLSKINLEQTPEVDTDLTITSLKIDKEGWLWFSSFYGIFRYHPQTKRLIKFETLDNKGNPITWFWTLAIDDDDIHWFCSSGNGVVIYNPNILKVKNHEINLPGVLLANDLLVQAAYEDTYGNMWLATNKYGLVHYNVRKEVYTRIKEVPVDNITCLEADKEDVLWIGSKANGLFKYDCRKRVLLAKNILLEAQGTAAFRKISVLYKDTSNVLWIGTEEGKGVVALNTETLTSELYGEEENNGTDNQRLLSHGRVEAITEDALKNIWIGTQQGLNYFDRSTKTFKKYFFKNNDPRSLSSSVINALLVDSQNQLWVGTASGLNQYQPGEDNFKRLNFTSESIFNIIADKYDNIWFSSEKAFSVYNPREQSTLDFGVSYHLEANQLLQNSALLGRNRDIFFTGRNGFSSFQPSDIYKRQPSGPLVFTSFKVFDQEQPIAENSILPKHIGSLDEIILTDKEKTVSFEFIALNYTLSELTSYSYQLSGFSNDWIDLGKKRELSFTNLAPGRYNLRIRAKNAYGEWDGNTAELAIEVLPPFWRTWWFYTILAVVAFWTVLLIYILRIRNLKNKNVELEKLVAERTKSLSITNATLERQKEELQESKKEIEENVVKLKELDDFKVRLFINISHELRTPLSLILGHIDQIVKPQKNFSFKAIVKKLNTAKRNGVRLMELINQILDLGKIETATLRLHVEKTPIKQFVGDLMFSFEDLANELAIDLKMIAPENDHFLWIDRDKMEKALFNLLSNAFKFTEPGGAVTVILDYLFFENTNVVETIRISVKDTGQGISKKELPLVFDLFYQIENRSFNEVEGFGIGLAYTKELIERHKGKIKVESRLGVGTTFSIDLLTQTAHFDKEDIVEVNQISNKDTKRTKKWAKQLRNAPKKHKRPKPLKIDPDKPSVIIAEDHRDIRALMKEELMEEFNVYEANDGTEVLELLEVKKIHADIIVSDVMMPRLDGINLCIKIKDSEAFSQIPVILLTAKGGEENTISGLEIGADDYITKPFSPLVLKHKIKNIIEARTKLKALYAKNFDNDFKTLTNTYLDEKFLEKTIKVIHDNIENPDFSNEELITQMGMSRTALYAKLKALTDMTVSNFIKTVRLKKAVELLQHTDLRINEVSIKVGFKDHSHFTKSFKKQFDQTPTEVYNLSKTLKTST